MADKKDSGSGAAPLPHPAHTLPYENVLKELDTKLDDGITTDEAKRRLQQYGPNKLDEGEGISLLKIFVRQVANAMMLVKGSTFLCDLAFSIHNQELSV